MAEPVAVTRRWRVRWWIRVAVVLGLLLLAAEQADVVRRAGRGELPGSEVRDGYLALVGYAVAGWLLAFRPEVRLTATGRVVVRNPIRVTTFDRHEVIELRPTPHGVAFHLADGRRPWTIVLQPTAHRREPRWFDVAEAITGRRPVLFHDELDDG